MLKGRRACHPGRRRRNGEVERYLEPVRLDSGFPQTVAVPGRLVLTVPAAAAGRGALARNPTETARLALTIDAPPPLQWSLCAALGFNSIHERFLGLQVEVDLLSRFYPRNPSACASDLRRIFEQSFPRHEREPFEEVFPSNSLGQLQVAVVEGHLAGFADQLDLGNGVHFLRYLAVDAPLRSRGIGQQLLRVMDSQMGSAFDHMLFEVEEPSVAEDPVMAVRRIRFFERWAAHQVRCVFNYYYPNPLNKGERIPILLFERHSTEVPCLAGDQLKQTFKALYGKYYGAQAAALHLEELLTRVRC